MRKEKTRLADLASKMRVSERSLDERSISEKRKADFGDTAIEPNPPHGEKGNFRKMTVTLPQAAYEKLVAESARRKIAGEPNHLLSAIVREAVGAYFETGQRLESSSG